MCLQGRGQRVQPMDGVNEISHRLGRNDVFDAQWNDRHTAADRPLDFTPDLRRRVRIGRKDENHHAAIVQGVNQSIAVFNASSDVAWCNPTTNSRSFQGRAGGVSGGLVLT